MSSSDLSLTLAAAVEAAAAGQLSEARQACEEMLREDPANAAALQILGAIASAEGDLEAAEEYLIRAIALKPDKITWLRDLAINRVASSKWTAASEALSRFLSHYPKDVEATRLLARAHEELQQFDLALAAYARWVELDAGAEAAWLGAANCLLCLKQKPEAAEFVRRWLESHPDSARGHAAAGEIHFQLNEHEEALIERLEAMRLSPGESIAMAHAALAYYHVGETDAAIDLFRRIPAGELTPGAHAAYLVTLLHHAGSDARLIREEHEAWGRRHAGERATPAVRKARGSDRRLRVAVICGEPLQSPVYRFVAPLLRSHDRSRVDLAVYGTDLRPGDSVNWLLEGELRNATGWPGARIADRIQRDGTDILMDVSGHYGGSLLVSAHRPAPIQVCLPNYPTTTGMSQMDYVFTDRWVCPPGQEPQYTEQPYMLECGHLIYEPPECTGPVTALPALALGSITFGIFQRPAKLNARVWGAVAEILRRVPNSRLLIHFAVCGLESEASRSRQRIEACLASLGVDRERLLFRGSCSVGGHFELVSTVDIGLDSFPYSGATTTCDCLWMGVPVVTLALETHVSRVSASLLMRAGLGDLVASDLQGYIDIAVRMANDIRYLGTLRSELRQRFQKSTIADPARLAREVEDAYQWMWGMWDRGCRNG